MSRSGQTTAPVARAITYCLVPYDLAAKLHEPLRRHFREEAAVEVVVESRGCDRRTTPERRTRTEPVAQERRRIRAADGRRVAERRVATVEVDPPAALPRRARAHLDRVVFVERLEPSTERVEDADSARLITRFQSGDRDVFATIYMRYFDRVYSYLRVALRDAHEAEDGAQQVFMRVFEALPRYERRAQPFRAWLFRIVRNHTVDELRKRQGLDLVEPDELAERHREGFGLTHELPGLGWISDRELLMFIERLPLAQRQVLMLRFMLDLRVHEVADVLGRSPNDVSALQHRALRFLRDRLEAVSVRAERPTRAPMREVVRPARVLRRRRFALAP